MCLAVGFLVSCSKDDPAPPANPYTYKFDEKGCSTQVQQFKNQEELCLGLQNEKLNSFCAFTQRKNHFASVCPNQEFKADWGVSSEAPSSQVEVNVLSGGAQSTKESSAMQISPNSASPEFARVQSACAAEAKLQELAQPNLKFAGFLMFSGDTVLVKNEQDAVQAFKCESNTVAEQAVSVLGDAVEIKNLPNKGLAIEMVYVRDEKKMQSEWLLVSCFDSVSDIIQRGRAGLSMTLGSKVLLKRNLDYRFSDGSDQKNEKPFVLIQCQ